MHVLKTAGFGLFLIIISALAFPALTAHAAIYMKLGDIKGETSATQATALQVQGTLMVESGTFNVDAVVGSSYVLDGTQSQDDSRRMHKWRQTSGPMTTLADASTIRPSFTPTQAGIYVFELVVVDSTGKESVLERVQFTVDTQGPTTRATPSPTPPVIDGVTVKEEATAVGSANGGVWKTTNSGTPDDEKLTPVLLELDGLKGESPEGKKGNVEHEWKVEEGESIREDDDSDENTEKDGNPTSARKGGVSIAVGDVNGLTEEQKTAFRWMASNPRSDTPISDLARGVLLSDPALRGVKISETSVEVETEEEAMLFGFIKIPFRVVVVGGLDSDGSSDVEVKMPWWSFLATTDFDSDGFEATGKSKVDSITIKQGTALSEMLSSISNVLKTKHDTAKNSVGNVH